MWGVKVIGMKEWGRHPSVSRHSHLALFRRGEAFIVPSEHMRSKLAILGCPVEKIHLIRPGLDIDKYVYHPKYKIKAYEVRILTVARYADMEGMHTLIEGFADLIRTSHPQSKLMIIGDGEGRDDLEDLVDYQGLKDHVEIIGERDTESIQQQLQQCDLLVLSATSSEDNREDIPPVLFEAMIAGRMVIACDYGGIPELIEDKKTGYLFAKKDSRALCEAMKYALDHTWDWKHMLFQARKKIEAEFDSRKQTEKIEKLINEIGERKQVRRKRLNNNRKNLR